MTLACSSDAIVTFFVILRSHCTTLSTCVLICPTTVLISSSRRQDATQQPFAVIYDLDLKLQDIVMAGIIFTVLLQMAPEEEEEEGKEDKRKSEESLEASTSVADASVERNPRKSGVLSQALVDRCQGEGLCSRV